MVQEASSFETLAVGIPKSVEPRPNPLQHLEMKRMGSWLETVDSSSSAGIVTAVASLLSGGSGAMLQG